MSVDATGSSQVAATRPRAYRYAVPRLPRPLARRQRLLEQLDSSIPLTVVRGPVGVGKSTLVAQWLAGLPQEIDAAWVTLDEDIDSAARLWEEIGQALGVTGVVSPGADLIASRRAIRHAIHRWSAPLVIVVEAYERIHDPQAHRDVAELLRQCPNLRLVVCTRADGRLRDTCRRQGVESTVIDVRDLLLTPDETYALFGSFGLELPPQWLTDLHRETGGWPAILWAIGNALAHESCPWSHPIDQVVREHVDGWVRNEVLPALSPLAASEWVFRLTVPERLDDEIARRVIGDDPRAVLDCLMSHGLLVQVPTTTSRPRTYVWPRLVRSALRSSFAAEVPRAVQKLDGELSDWFHARGEHVHALRHALSADDLERARLSVEQGWITLLAVDRSGLDEFFRRMTPEELSRSRKLRAVRELAVPPDGDPAARPGPRAVLGRTELELIGRSTDPRAALDEGLLALLSLRRFGDPGQARELAARLTSIASAARGTRSEQLGDLLCPVFKEAGVLHLAAGDTHTATDTLRWAYETAPVSPVPSAQADVSALLGLTMAVEGETARAETWLTRYETAAADLGVETIGGREAAAATALVAGEQLDRGRVLEALERGIRSCRAPGALWFYELYARGQDALLWGDRIGMLHRLSEVRSRREHGLAPGSFAEAVLAGLEVDLLLSLRSAPRARALLAGIESDQPLVALARARLALVVGDHRTAQRLAGARRWDERCSSRVRTDLKLTYAAATLASGDEATAVADLERLLTLAEVGSYRPFALVPPDLLTAAAELLPPLEKVVHVLEDAGVRGVLHRQDEMVELTPREQVVLEAIATSRTIEDIARSLHVSVNTVKSQTRSLYRKLGVRSRDEAVHSASIRGVLPPRDGSEAPG